jgi:hypothetical protein
VLDERLVSPNFKSQFSLCGSKLPSAGISALIFQLLVMLSPRSFRVTQRISPLLTLPCELLLKIFCMLPQTSDAVNLAVTCSHLYRLYQNGQHKLQILRSIIDLRAQHDYKIVEALSGKTSISTAQGFPLGIFKN